MNPTSLNFIIFFCGFISGFLILITGNTLNFWIAKEGLSAQVVGLFSLVSLPYAINFLWAPIFDHIKLDFIPTQQYFRVKWLMLLHSLGFVICAIMSLYGSENLPMLALLALLSSFVNSSQDVVLNAYRAEFTPEKFKASSAGFYIFGYRMGMVLSGSFAIYLSEYISFSTEYAIFGLFYLMFAGILSRHMSSPEYLSLDNNHKSTESSSGLIFHPKVIFHNFGGLSTVAIILSFLALYRLGDNFIGAMLNPYLLSLHFNEEQIAFSGKLSGIIGSSLGGIIASYLITNHNIARCLLWFGIIHSIAHIGYIFIHHSLSWALFTVTMFDSITGGMTMSCYIALMTMLCKGKYKTTQYAAFSSMMGLSRTILPSISGYLAILVGWDIFFILSAVMIVPSLLLLQRIDPHLLNNGLLNSGHSNRGHAQRPTTGGK